jgi:hypothetical protein
VANVIISDMAVILPRRSSLVNGRDHYRGRSGSALGAFYRHLAARAGKAKPVTTTARKIAVLFYNILRHGITDQASGAFQ